MRTRPRCTTTLLYAHTMSKVNPTQAGAALIAMAWRDGTTLDALPDHARPTTLAQGYAIQRALGAQLGDTSAGWKIAATSANGQQHIGVDGPIAGRLFARRLLHGPARVSLNHNRMGVAECEFVFKLRHDLPPTGAPYTRDDVLAAVDALHPGIELPNSRFIDFAAAGAPQLAADNACAHDMVIGEAVASHWRDLDLAQVRTAIHINGKLACSGSGADVLGHPLDALAWLANAHAERGTGLTAGEWITTGVTGQPTPVARGDDVEARLEGLGSVSVTLT